MTRRRLRYPVAALAVLGVLLTLCLPLAAHGAMSDEDFARLCEKGTAQQVRDALRNGANPNANDYGLLGGVGTTALMKAVWNKNPEVVSLLLKAGADVNARDEYGCTALMHAAATHHIEVISLLLKAGADVNAKGSDPLVGHDGDTVLMWAIDKTITGIITSRIVARREAEATGKTEEEAYAQMLKEAEDEILKIIPILLDAGANVNAINNEGKTAYDCAIKMGYMDVAWILEVAERKQREQEAAQRKRLIIWGIILTVIAVVGGFMFMKHRKKILAHVPGNLDDVKENLKKAKDGLSGIAGTVGNAVKEKLKEGNFDGVKEKLREAKDGLSGIAGTMESSVKEKVKEAEKRVGKAPESEQSPMSPEQPSQSTSATPPAQPTPAAQPTPQAPATPEPETMKLARQGMELLKQGDFDTAEQCFNRILKLNPKSANAYTGKLRLAHRARNANELVASSTPLEDDDLFKSALKYAGPKLRAALEQYVRINRARIAKAKQQAAAQEAQDLGNGKAV